MERQAQSNQGAENKEGQEGGAHLRKRCRLEIAPSTG